MCGSAGAAAMLAGTRVASPGRAHTRLPAALLALCLVVTLLGACTSREDRYRQHLSKGRAFFDREEFDKAGVEFRNALQVNPRSAEVHYWTGRHAEATRLWQQAFGAYLKSVEHDPASLEALGRLARLYLMVRDLPRAERRVAEMRTVRADDPDAQALSALLLAARGELARAEEEAARVLERAPGHPEATALIVERWLRQHDFGRARAVLEREITANPRSIELRVLYGTVLARLEDTRRLEENHRNLVLAAPRRLELRLAQAGFYTRLGRVEVAESVLREAINVLPDDEQRYIALVDFLVAQRGIDAGVAELRGVIERRPRAHELSLKLAQLEEGAGRTDAAQALLKRVIQLDKGGAGAIGARLQLAGLLQRTGQLAAAEATLEQVLKDNPRDARGLQLRSRLALARRDYPAAIADLRTLLRDQPGSASVVATIAAAHREAGEPALAREAIANAIARFPHNGELRLVAADFLLGLGDRAAALRELEQLLAREPRNVRAYEMRGAILVAGRDLGTAAQNFNTLKAMAPESASGPRRLAQVLFQMQRPDAAVRELEVAFWRSTDMGEVLQELTAAYAQYGLVDAGLARARAIAQRDPDSVRPHLLMGHLQLTQRRYIDAERAFARAQELAPTQAGPVIGLARSQDLRGDRKAAIATLEQAQAAQLGDPALVLALAELLQASGDTEAAITHYEHLLRRAPANEVIANNLAWLLAEHRGGREDLDRALALARRFDGSGNPSFLDTLGWIHVKRGDADLAIPILRRALERAPQAPGPMYHLGVAMLQVGRVDEGRSLLRRAVQSTESFIGRDEARRLLAQG